MSVIDLNTHNFHKEVTASDKPVLLDFWAPWCGPCRTAAPIIEQIAAEYPGIKVGKINVDEEPVLAAQFEIKGIPTLILMKQGQILNRTTGAKRKDAIAAMLKAI